MTDTPLPFITRLWFAFLVFFRVLFDASFGSRVFGVHKGGLPEPEAKPLLAESKGVTTERERSMEAAFQMLALLQREGRLVDFLQQDITRFGDAEIGAVARVVHDGCRRAIQEHMKIVPVRSEQEGASVALEAGFDAESIKLTGDVCGSAPFRGVLRHRGWRAESLELPKVLGEHDLTVLAPAEVEL